MESKQNRIKELLRQRGIDGAIVSSPENFHYVAGFSGHQHTVSRIPGYTEAVMRAEDDIPTHVITMDFEVPTFMEKRGSLVVKKYDTWVGVRQWEEIRDGLDAAAGGVVESSMDVLVRTVRELELYDRTIGVEMAYLPAQYYDTLREKLPEARFEDISPLFIHSRSVKTAEEIRLFRDLCAVVDGALTAVREMVREGVTENELAQCFRERAIASGICVPSTWSMFSTGPNGARLTLPENRTIADGDVVKFDGGVNAGHDFYTTDTSRAWITGNADPVLHRLKERLYEAKRKMIAMAKPGVPICEVFRSGYEWVRAAYPSYRRGHLGHSISMGPSTAEAPIISADEKRPLEPGMILAFETPCYIHNVAGFNIEDMVLITDGGCEVLTGNTSHFLDGETR